MRTIACVIAALVACGPGSRSDYGGGGGGGGDGLADGANGDCSAAAKMVYTVDDQTRQLSQFDPATKTFKDLGALSCAGSTGTPLSMGVDRNTVAWVLYTDGVLFRVDILNNLACTKTTWASPSGLVQFGMGFSTDVAGGTADSLFVGGGAAIDQGPTAMLAKLDTAAFTAKPLGSVQGWPELTGNANAELWGWFPSDLMGTTTPRVEQLDKTTGGAVKTFMLPTLQGTPAAWAFAFWGGDYWIFLMKGTDLATVVYQIDGSSGAIKTTTPTTGRKIVGAGVSTCAPVVIM